MNICDLVSFLNNNSGASMIVLTAIYVGATIWIVRTNYKVIREMRLGREQLTKPLLLASFESRRGGLMCFVLRNHGGSAATNLRVELTSDDFIKSLPADRKGRFERLKAASLTIVPRQEILFPIGGPSFWEKIFNTNIEGKLVYNDIFNKENEQPFAINLESFEGSLIYGTEIDELTTTIKRSLYNIEKTLQSVISIISDPAKTEKPA